ncbi:MAG TPA: hypothetical protein VFD43_09060 [Planctomycetota bacterium]|nr:hypothetical protein [Planctomycetota bacterium]
MSAPRYQAHHVQIQRVENGFLLGLSLHAQTIHLVAADPEAVMRILEHIEWASAERRLPEYSGAAAPMEQLGRVQPR